MTPQPSLCHLHPILQPAKPNHRAGGKGSKTHSEGAAGSGVPPGNCPASPCFPQIQLPPGQPAGSLEPELGSERWDEGPPRVRTYPLQG